MKGAIIGDILGSSYEFDSLLPGTSFEITAESDFTDDSVLTFAVADAIINKKSIPQTIKH